MFRNVTVVILSCLLILVLTGATVAQQSQAAQRINLLLAVEATPRSKHLLPQPNGGLQHLQ